MDFLRLFIALPISETVKQELQTVQDTLKTHLPHPEIGWTTPEQWHLTLVFLGMTPVEKLGPIQQAMKRAIKGLGPLTLSTAGLGTFPSFQRPSVLWLGLSGETNKLQHLHDALNQQLSGLFESEERSFKAHITLARIKQFGLGKEVRKAFADTPSTPQEWQVNEVRLYSSQLKHTGSEFTRVFTLNLDKSLGP
jgi:RNA 2',3'-cyclic 3'-phosphodiesterase